MSDLVRVEGEKKVRGERIFARDFLEFERIPDKEDWPKTAYHALLVRAKYADRVCFYDSDEVKRGVKERFFHKPVEITASRLRAAGIELNVVKGKAVVFGHNWLVPDHEKAEHIGQPVAILLFHSRSILRDFQRWVEQGGNPVKYDPPPAEARHLNPVKGPEQDVRGFIDPLISSVQKDHDPTHDYGSTHYVRLADGTDEFSHVTWGKHNPWAIGPDPDVTAEQRAVNVMAYEASEAINRAIAQNDLDQASGDQQDTDSETYQQSIAQQKRADRKGWRVLRRVYSTQITDPMFLEPEAGLGWWDRAANVLRLVIGSQSPNGDREDIRSILKKAKSKGLATAEVEVISCYLGGGFGGRDVSSFPMYLALAAIFAKGPVRLAYDRYEQFQVGVKRHASVVENVLAYFVSGSEEKRVTLEAFRSTIYMDGGGELNLTRPVVTLAALHAAGPYRIPRTTISAYGTRTRGAPAGSKRGFGIPQVTFAIESMVDEVAERVKVDPIELRLQNVLRQGDCDVAGVPLHYPLANEAICKKAIEEDLWKKRDERKKQYEETVNAQGGERLLSYGVGFACCMEAYGTTRDGVFAAVELTPEGKVVVWTPAVDMGQGSATALAQVATKAFDEFCENNAVKKPFVVVNTGQTKVFDALGLCEVEAKDAATASETQDQTLRLINSSSASMTAFHHAHALERACGILKKLGVGSAAERLRGNGHDNPSLRDVAQRAHADSLPFAVMVHTYYQAKYATARFTTSNGDTFCEEVDAVAVRQGEKGYIRLPRSDVQYHVDQKTERYPRSLYASVGHIVAVEVQHHTGHVQVVDVVSILDAGAVIHKELLIGQAEGGFAMGIGYALMECLPPAPEGVDGTWNLDRYKVPRPRDMPFKDLTAGKMNVIPADRDSWDQVGTPDQPKKGIAEASMTTVAPAIANAVAHATGLRFNSLPISAEHLRRELYRLKREEA